MHALLRWFKRKILGDTIDPATRQYYLDQVDQIMAPKDDPVPDVFEQLAPAGKHPVIRYPEQIGAEAWVTDELMARTGGMTRHPMDITNYPSAPTEADLAARRAFRVGSRFSHGYSMHYLRSLQARAQRHDTTLTTEELMALRARNLA